METTVQKLDIKPQSTSSGRLFFKGADFFNSKKNQEYVG